MPAKKKVHIVSLGCPKNLVDSEVIAAALASGGYLLTDRPEEASIILINTCAFILPAKEESIEEILRMAAWKRGGKAPCTHLVVTGCLPQRYGHGLTKALPEVDLFLGIAEIPNVARHLDSLFEALPHRRHSVIGKPAFLMTASHRRLISEPAHSAYLKIADGCSNRCSYCAIPAIRGKARSRTIDDIVEEAELLAAQGVRELVITPDSEPPSACRGQSKRHFLDPCTLYLPGPSDGRAALDNGRGRENLPLPGHSHPAQR
jgi:ribosomal protein S12 methylthiotransferase